jgi:uncharacterized membrane protein
LPSLTAATGDEMVTVFVPSSPTAFSGYVLVVPRPSIVELPLTVEEAMRLLVSGGVLMPTYEGKPRVAQRGEIATPQAQPPSLAAPAEGSAG